MKDPLISQYEGKLEAIRAMHGNSWKGEDYVAFAELELKAVKAGGLPAPQLLWASKVTE